MIQLFIKLEDDQRGWIVSNLEDVKGILDSLAISEYPFAPTSIEFIEHMIAVFDEKKCNCGADFSK